jgi:hypothetical protein
MTSYGKGGDKGVSPAKSKKLLERFQSVPNLFRNSDTFKIEIETPSTNSRCSQSDWMCVFELIMNRARKCALQPPTISVVTTNIEDSLWATASGTEKGTQLPLDRRVYEKEVCAAIPASLRGLCITLLTLV